MRLGWLALVALVGCHDKPATPPPAAAGSGSATGSGSAAPAGAAGVLAFDRSDPTDPFDYRDVAFGGKHPRLPAVNADGSLIADYDWAGGMPSGPIPIDFVLRIPGSDKIVERITILDDKDSADAIKATDGAPPHLPPEVAKRVAERGPRVLPKLQGFHSLDEVELTMKSPSGEPGPATLGDLTFDPDLVELRDAHGRVLQSAAMPDYTSSDKTCSYTPMFRALYRDPANGMLYVEDSYHYRDDCPDPPVYVFAWSTDPAKADPDAAIRGLVSHQFDAVPAIPLTTNGQSAAALAAKAKPADKYDDAVTISRDGSSAWGGASAGDVVIASDVLVRTPKGWQLAGAAWTVPVDNDQANHDAKAGKLHAATLAGDPGDQSLRDAFAKLATDGVDAAAAARPDLVAIGSAPGERSKDGPSLARAWKGAWLGKVRVVASVAHVTPSGTTGWVTASVELAKKGYKIPLTVFAVFDKVADGSWSLVRIHFAV